MKISRHGILVLDLVEGKENAAVHTEGEPLCSAKDKCKLFGCLCYNQFN